MCIVFWPLWLRTNVHTNRFPTITGPNRSINIHNVTQIAVNRSPSLSIDSIQIRGVECKFEALCMRRIAKIATIGPNLYTNMFYMRPNGHNAADDAARERTVENLRQLMDRLSQACEECGLTVRIKKTKVTGKDIVSLTSVN